MREIYDRAQQTKTPQIGLELEFDMPNAFIHFIFGSNPANGFPTKGNEQPRSNRPDILIFGRREQDKNTDYELCSDGTVRMVDSNDRRVGVSIIDIKNSQHDRIGLRHFSELIFYAYALRFFFDHTTYEIEVNDFFDIDRHVGALSP